MTDRWEPRRLGTLLKLTSGQSPSGFKFGPLGTPYYKVEQLGRSTKYLSRDSTPYFSTDVPQVPTGSVLIAKRGAAIALNRVRLLTEPSFMDTNVMALTPNNQLAPEFLYYWLSQRGLWDIADVTSVPQINNKHIVPLEIPLPSPDEQRRIVAVLHGTDDLIEALRRQIAKKHAIKGGIAQQLLSGRSRVCGFVSEWANVRLGNTGVTYGGLTGKSKADFGSGSARFVTFLSVINQVRLHGDSLEPVMVGTLERQNQVARGDVLFNGSSETPDEVALGAAVDFTPAPGTYLNSFCFGFRIVRKDLVDPTYIAYMVRSRVGRQLVSSLAQGAIRYNISKRRFLDLAPPFPPLEEQRAIVNVLTDADTEIDLLKRRLEKVKAVKEGIAQQLLTGRVRLPDLEPVA